MKKHYNVRKPLRNVRVAEMISHCKTMEKDCFNCKLSIICNKLNLIELEKYLQRKITIKKSCK